MKRLNYITYKIRGEEGDGEKIKEASKMVISNSTQCIIINLILALLKKKKKMKKKPPFGMTTHIIPGSPMRKLRYTIRKRNLVIFTTSP